MRGHSRYPRTGAQEAPTREQLQQYKANYNAIADRLREVITDFDRTLSPDIPIPEALVDAIQGQDLRNGPVIAYHLGCNPRLIDSLWNLSAGELRRWVVELSESLKGKMYV